MSRMFPAPALSPPQRLLESFTQDDGRMRSPPGVTSCSEAFEAAAASRRNHYRSTSNPDVPTDGISLSALRHFAALHAAQLAGLSTSAVCFDIVKPATCAKSCSFIDLLREEETDEAARGLAGPAVGRADVFVSHAWGNSFLDLVAAVLAHDYSGVSTIVSNGIGGSNAAGGAAVKTGRSRGGGGGGGGRRGDDAGCGDGMVGGAGAPEVFVWIDIFTVNQHNESCAAARCACGAARPLPPQTWWSGAFKAAIQRFGHVIAVLEPWDRPLPLSRAWCLWELLCAIEGGVSLEIALSPGQREAFLCALSEDAESVRSALSQVDARNATAWLERDRLMILGAVERGCGFEALNQLVVARLRSWVVDRGRAALAALPAAERGCSRLLLDFAKMLNHQGHIDEAARCARESLDMRRAMLGPASAEALEAGIYLGGLLQQQGRLAEAETLMVEELEAKREAHGRGSAEALLSLSKLASVYEAQGRGAEAEAAMREAADGLAANLGDRHRYALTACSNLGALLRAAGRLDEAEPLLRRVLDGRRATLPPRHPHTMVAASNLGVLLLARGSAEALAEAEPLFAEDLAASREVLGDAHPDTLVSISRMGALRLAQGRLEDSEKLMREAAAGAESSLGPQHPHTAGYAFNLGALLAAMGRPEAREALLRALSVREAALGPQHPLTEAARAALLRLDVIEQRKGLAAVAGGGVALFDVYSASDVEVRLHESATAAAAAAAAAGTVESVVVERTRRRAAAEVAAEVVGSDGLFMGRRGTQKFSS